MHDIFNNTILNLNLNLRQDNKRLSRKTISYSKKV
ncbi:MAG: hypothetical protein LBD03_01825 [Methanobrevibacter sp.]|nr:hypothetical protein [Candidatus Methanovirga procula]